MVLSAILHGDEYDSDSRRSGSREGPHPPDLPNHRAHGTAWPAAGQNYF